MKILLHPEKENWNDLCIRPMIPDSNLESIVSEIISKVKSEGDNALYYYAEKFDGVNLRDIRISSDEISASGSEISGDLKNAIAKAKANIEKFHLSQLFTEPVVETARGVKCWRRNIPVENVGLYVPGGSAPLFSTLLMLGIPAKIAGCKNIVVCTPPAKDGKINPVILYTAGLTGITKIFKTGGAQAIAAMAYGTETIPKVSKVFGPGNQYVTKAKELVQREGTAIDMPAGPSEVLVIADKKANPVFVAADLLSQAEHGPDSQVIMVTDSDEIIVSVRNEVDRQVMLLPRKEIALKALENSKIILFNDLAECMEFSNLYAPEHLIINTSDPMDLASEVICAGSVFLGKYSCESAGDYASGTNHTLPTNGFAKNYSGVSVDSFMKKITFQELSSDGIKNIGETIEILAEAESLLGHKNAVSVRLKSIRNERSK